MTHQQLIAILAPVPLTALMIPLFRVFARRFQREWRIGWFLGC